MQRTVKTENLKIGMYVILPVSWLSHPFIKSEFLIKSKDQIKKIYDYGLSEIVVDTKRSTFTEAKKKLDTESEHNLKPLSRTIVPDDLLEAIHDTKLPPMEKAKAVQAHSFTLINNLLENPTAENIQDAKKGIAEVVDLILTDDKTSLYLLSITSHDFYTYTHSVNVGFLAVSLSKALFRKSTAHNMHELGAGFFLHDLGKVQVDTAIINKPGRLTEEEMNTMKQHPNMGYKVLHETNQLTPECKRIVLQHHERYDGKGYPLGLKGDDIHIYGKMCSIADVFDALTSNRPYRQKLGPFDALKLMKEEMMDHFHRELFEQFVLLFSDTQR
ncbi:MAG TPA: HD-GYP domain-containing protein [Syntrophales bacterium]|nr:HD-GYP domain-containing protein [Syntrophales bacterium]